MNRSDGSTASYYELPKGCTELQDLISYRNLNAQDGEIFRAVYRKGRASHSDEMRDAKKVLFYAMAEVKRLEALRNEQHTADYTDKHDTFGSPLPVEPASEIDDESPRMQAIGQNGEMAEEVYAAIDGLIKWEGGICPVDPSFTVAYVMAAGDSTHYDNAGKLRWLHTGRESDIVAYRIHKES